MRQHTGPGGQQKPGGVQGGPGETIMAMSAMLDTATFAKIEAAIEYIYVNGRSRPDIAEIARASGLSRAHFSRLFKRWCGLAPHQFLQVVTLDQASHVLQQGSVMSAALEAGLSGPSRLHDLFVSVQAVSPGEWSSGGQDLCIRWGTVPSPFGNCLLGWTHRGICYLVFGERSADDASRELQLDWPGARLLHAPNEARELAGRVFTARRERLGLHLSGTNFQVQVWQALMSIPSGATVAYGELAKKLGRPGAARAVGSAAAANRIGWLIPCHRVLQAQGGIGGYRWGPGRKQAMLAWEKAQAAGSN